MKYIKVLAFSMLMIASATLAKACTIFILTDSERTLFFNNEDFSNPNTRIWFVPSGNGYMGCAYVGFDNGWAQGGVNTAGLAFDWVAGFMDAYTPDAALIQTMGNSSERMLETCKTIEEAIKFYQTYREPSFGSSRMIIADKTGASLIIGVRNGELFFDRSVESRGFGYGYQILQKELNPATPAKLQTGTEILSDCTQAGETPTQYATIYDLRNGKIYVHPLGANKTGLDIDMKEELSKGSHYYNIPDIQKEYGQGIKLELNMKRLFLYEFQALQIDAELTETIKNALKNAYMGKMQKGDYTQSLWNQLKSQQIAVQGELVKLGEIESLHLVKRKTENTQTNYDYIVVFDNARALMRFQLDENNLINYIETLFARMTLK